MISRFPNRSKVIYSEQQKQSQKRFSDAIDFARVVIKEPGLKNMYSIKATLLGFRSAWNLAIAEFMSDKPLEIKKKKIRFDKSILKRSLGWNIPVKLYKFADEPQLGVFKVARRLRSKYRRDRTRAAVSLADFSLVDMAVNYLDINRRNIAETVPYSNFKYFTLLHDDCQH